MKKESTNTAAARQIEMVLRRLSALSTLPAVAKNFLPALMKGHAASAELVAIIQNDPALTARMLSLAQAKGLNTASVAQAVKSLDQSLVRDAILSVKVFEVFDPDYDPDKKRPLPRKQLAVHALAVACCAREIALAAKSGLDPETVFAAGLLHDIGKLAIDEVMPKSFEKIVDEARANASSIAAVETKYLGMDHCLIGKRLAEKWNLPAEIIAAIWLHHSDAGVIAAHVADANIAQIVGVADAVARTLKLGDSGSYDTPELSDDMWTSLSLGPGDRQRIAGALPEMVAQKTSLLSLDDGADTAAYCDAVKTTAVTFAHENTRLGEENRRLAASASICGFLTDFIAANAAASTLDVATDFAARLAKFLNTAPICVIVDLPGQDLADAVVVDASGEPRFSLIKPLTVVAGSKWRIADASGQAHELFTELDARFDPQTSKIAPLAARGKTAGWVVFEMPAAGQTDFDLRLEALASAAAVMLLNAQGYKRQEEMTERFARLIGELRQMQEQLSQTKSMLAVAEIAAGAAHELNNPLAVISGRAQILASAEEDANKKQMLKQIQDRTAEMAGMITDLMAYAKPAAPQKTAVSVKDLFDEAIARVRQDTGLSVSEVIVGDVSGVPNVNVDKGQLAAAIANIITNALESYSGQSGPVQLSAALIGDSVELTIRDSGSGMDAQTLRNAAHPFFSARPAGRKRGMGLAHALRYIEHNGGKLKLMSSPQRGTTASISLLST